MDNKTINFTETDDQINHPSHYTWIKDKVGIEVIDITRHLDFDLGNAIKYILRAGKKPINKSNSNLNVAAIQDLKKAIRYNKNKIKMIENETYKTNS